MTSLLPELLKTVGFIGFADKKCESYKNSINICPRCPIEKNAMFSFFRVSSAIGKNNRNSEWFFIII
jgi:hypothetical protein